MVHEDALGREQMDMTMTMKVEHLASKIFLKTVVVVMVDEKDLEDRVEAVVGQATATVAKKTKTKGGEEANAVVRLEEEKVVRATTSRSGRAGFAPVS